MKALMKKSLWCVAWIMVFIFLFHSKTEAQSPNPNSALQKTNQNIHFVCWSFTCAGTYLSNDIWQMKIHENVSGPAVDMSYMPVQYAYAASMDIDLAPKLTERKSLPYNSDGFVPLDGNLTNRFNVNNFGFRNEDFDYALPDKWAETLSFDGKPEYERDTSPSHAGVMIWGQQIGLDSFFNYRIPRKPYKSSDGVTYNVYEVDDIYHPPYQSEHDEANHEGNVKTEYYRMACSIGSSLSPIFVGMDTKDAVSVKVAKDRRGEVDNSFDDELEDGTEPLSENLKYLLCIGVLGSF